MQQHLQSFEVFHSRKSYTILESLSGNIAEVMRRLRVRLLAAEHQQFINYQNPVLLKPANEDLRRLS